MMRYELGLEKPQANRATQSAVLGYRHFTQ